MKTITFTNDEIETLKGMLGSYISYMRASGADEDYYEVRVCKSFIEKLDKENKKIYVKNVRGLL